MKKILGVILGVLMCIGGFYCMLMPGAAFSSLTISFGISMIESAVAYFVLWRTVKKIGGKSGLLLLNAILSLIAGIGLLTNPVTQMLVENVMLDIISFFIGAMGVVQIVNAFNLRKIEGSHWVLNLVAGILIFISGAISFTNPAILGLTIGMNMAFNIFSTGLTLIVVSLAYKGKEKIVEKVR